MKYAPEAKLFKGIIVVGFGDEYSISPERIFEKQSSKKHCKRLVGLKKEIIQSRIFASPPNLRVFCKNWNHEN
jgi:hypothetical protein